VLIILPKLIISLTTIPPRIAKIGPTLRDLLNQSADVHEIRLNLARNYRRFPGETLTVPDLPEGVTVHWSDQDYGPATKIFPTVHDHRGEDVEILFCDDDQPYEPKWAQRFLDARASQPNSCIVGKGYDLDQGTGGGSIHFEREHIRFPRAVKRTKGVGYRLLRAASLGLIKPYAYVKDGYVDIMEGYRGVLVKPDFFLGEAFDIPDILWTVDDPWLSGQLERNNVPIWLMAKARQYSKTYDAHNSNRLGAYVYRDHGRIKADAACINYFRETYGIWQDRTDTSGTKTT